MAFPKAGFEALGELFGAQAECFASPLNCTFNKFCSVAFDTDRHFGSCGSFWKFQGHAKDCWKVGLAIDRGGSYEANPPFVEEVMENMARRIINLLEDHERKGSPLSFAVIVPGWDDDDCRSFHLMKDSTFNRGPRKNYYLILERSRHKYRPGMQHRMKHEEQVSNCKTFLFFLQNELGTKKWPVTKERLRQLQDRVAI